jgi:hypothetical protein
MGVPGLFFGGYLQHNALLNNGAQINYLMPTIVFSVRIAALAILIIPKKTFIHKIG